MNGPQQLESDLRDAFPQVALVSINGADDGETKSMGWDRLIQPLDRGSFDLNRVLRVLKQNEYQGPIGLQGYAIRERPEDFFPRSVAAYRQMLAKVNGSQD
jgi:sugar phosphate isomerase/epimerase